MILRPATPLRCAVYHKNLAAVEKLLERGAKPGHDAIVKAFGYIFFEAFLPALGPLLDAGADIDYALDYAIERKNVEATRICLDGVADPADTLARQRRLAGRKGAGLNGFASDEEDSEMDEESEEEVERKIAIKDFVKSLGAPFSLDE